MPATVPQGVRGVPPAVYPGCERCTSCYYPGCGICAPRWYFRVWDMCTPLIPPVVLPAVLYLRVWSSLLCYTSGCGRVCNVDHSGCGRVCNVDHSGCTRPAPAGCTRPAPDGCAQRWQDCSVLRVHTTMTRLLGVAHTLGNSGREALFSPGLFPGWD